MTQSRTGGPRTGGPQTRRTRALVAVVLAVALALFAGGLWVGSDDAKPYRGGPVSISTGVPSGVYYRYGQLLAPRLEADLGVPVTIDASAGSVDNVRRLIDGTHTLAIATADAVADLSPAERDQLRAIARLYDDYVQLVVPVSSPARSVADLRGKRVGIGPPASGVQLLANRILATAGLDARTDLVATEDGIGDTAAKLRDGRLDAFFWSGGLPTEAVRVLAEEADIRFVPLGDVAATLRDRYHQVYREAVIPSDAYQAGRTLPGVRQEVPTVAVPNLLVTRADTDPDLIRRVTGTVMGGREAIGREVHAAQLVDPRTAILTFPPLLLHEGARLWYRSAKP
ncbi:TAXI family TRAP transporter solute-binding subunit [Yinghuangia sp. ASG 101]|uniref:TAXI family TRAP transporter solute-binding subunit n=1 Tax=Yinghuangia sp. ASG 101 TaxID=2896848 RepID=UPI001E2D41DB|nr:TAXI family TRAP transporter solute-binding subunit [Yinghuangia sp. ASG 101]UGQ13917.1 TAXI family TRAP transporter solute-binding subunit [Yinghuangia sp. ASG 101]